LAKYSFFRSSIWTIFIRLFGLILSEYLDLVNVATKNSRESQYLRYITAFFASYRSGTAGTSHIPFSIAVSCQPPVISSELFFIMRLMFRLGIAPLFVLLPGQNQM
jgi:hypothetical protein